MNTKESAPPVRLKIALIVFAIVAIIAIATFAYIEFLTPTDSVRGQYLNHIEDVSQGVSNHDVSSLVGDYEANASVTWLGETTNLGGVFHAGDLGGKHSGIASIQNLYNTFFDYFLTLAVSNTTYSIHVLGNQSIVVMSSFYMIGALAGPVGAGENTASTSSSGSAQTGGICTGANMNATVIAKTTYTGSGLQWLISSETWTFQNVCS
jgi:hypothetical protein